MMRLPAPRLLPVTIVVTAILLALKSVSLGATALANVPGSTVSAVAVAGPATSDERPRLSRPTDLPSAPQTLTANDWSLLQDLRKQSNELDRRRHQLDLREAALQAAAQTMQAQLKQLNSLKGQLAAMETAREERGASDLLGIVKVYEAMRPADAAVIFNALNVQLLVRILDRMNERKAALVMGEMEPERARLATQLLAARRLQRNADPANVSPHSGDTGLEGAG